jgi:hypothetical protein
VKGLVVLDIVEGTALQSLEYIETRLRERKLYPPYPQYIEYPQYP